ncbi:MAG TPA: hypothetical protein VHD62_11565 [Opitutaceae bacterium]|nr:hypothetical protein [Opitutaceae bacterium]
MKSPIAPSPSLLDRWRGRVRGFLGARRLRRAVRSGAPLRLVVGSGGIGAAGWVATDIETLDLLLRSNWETYFRRDSITAILAEHVWEHLTLSEGRLAAEICHDYLRPGGWLRIAVPDGLHPDPGYVEQVRVGGSGAGAHDHRVLYTHETLGQLLREAGFTVEFLEYFDVAGGFHACDWQPADGPVQRSRRFDRRNRDGRLRYTSLIVDAWKPGGPPLRPAAQISSTLPGR